MFWPCAWALTMAAKAVGLPPMKLLQQFAPYFLGSTLLHSAACVINDICDIDFDRQVERTKNRPLACGAASVSEAVVFLVVLLLPCVYMLTWTNHTAFQVGLIGLFPLHALYPLMKRWTYWPQAWLGLAMNVGFPVAWVAVTGSIDWKFITVFWGGLVCWTIVYDTIYGCQDIKDDVKAGVKSTALLFGRNIRPILSLFAAAFIALLFYSGILNGQGPAYYLLTVLGAAINLAWQLSTVDFDDPADCWDKFSTTGPLGFLMWSGMFIDYLVQYSN